MSLPNYSIILSINYSKSQWTINGDTSNYSNIEWLDSSPKPTQQELDSLAVESELKQYNYVIDEQRKGAYEQISDPVFFKWQRGEATQEEWLAAVQQVKDMYPKKTV